MDIVTVSGTSMEPALHDGDRVFVSRVHYGLPIPFMPGYIIRWSTPKKGDIVVYSQPTDGRLAMKRVWAGPTTAVELENRRLRAEHISASVSPKAARAFREEPSVPRGELLVIGDNRVESVDSRHYGPIKIDSLIGKVIRWR